MQAASLSQCSLSQCTAVEQEHGLQGEARSSAGAQQAWTCASQRAASTLAARFLSGARPGLCAGGRNAPSSSSSPSPESPGSPASPRSSSPESLSAGRARLRPAALAERGRSAGSLRPATCRSGTPVTVLCSPSSLLRALVQQSLAGTRAKLTEVRGVIALSGPWQPLNHEPSCCLHTTKLCDSPLPAGAGHPGHRPCALMPGGRNAQRRLEQCMKRPRVRLAPLNEAPGHVCPANVQALSLWWDVPPEVADVQHCQERPLGSGRGSPD